MLPMFTNTNNIFPSLKRTLIPGTSMSKGRKHNVPLGSNGKMSAMQSRQTPHPEYLERFSHVMTFYLRW